MKKPLIAVYGIYKNEENLMEHFLNSAKTADEIVLCDTGSTDETNNIINNFMENNPDVNIKTYSIYVSPWRFDDARNTALSLVSQNIDICVSLDIDEYLSKDWKVNLIAQYEDGVTRYYHKFKTFWEDGTISEHLHDRIHVRKGYTWKLPVHEILEYNGVERTKFIYDFCIYQKSEIKETRRNYMALLEESVKERRDLWKSWSFLASEYVNREKYIEALNAIDTALSINNCDKAFLYKQKYYIYKILGENDRALFSINNAIFYLPERRELYFEKAKFLNQIKRNKESFFTILEAERKKDKIIDYHFEASAWDDCFESFKLSVYNLAKKDGLEI